jgi:hypothetical protein
MPGKIVAIEKVHLAQAKHYLEAYKMQIGLLKIFCTSKLKHSA